MGWVIMITSIGSVLCMFLGMAIAYVNAFEIAPLEPLISALWPAYIAVMFALFLGSLVCAFLLYGDASDRDWGPFENQYLFQRILIATFPIGNIIYYNRVMTDTDGVRPSSKGWLRPSHKRFFLDLLSVVAVAGAIVTLLSVIFTLFAPAIFEPFPRKMWSLARIASGSLMVTAVVLGSFHLFMVIDLARRGFCQERMPPTLEGFPYLWNPGKGAFTYYFRVLRKELSQATRAAPDHKSGPGKPYR